MNLSMASLIIFQIFTKAAQGAGLLPTYAAVCGLNLLPTLKVVAWVDFSRFVCVFVCLSVFPHDISIKNAAEKWQRNVPPWVLETHLFGGQRWKIKVTRHKKTVPARSWHSRECWLFLVLLLFILCYMFPYMFFYHILMQLKIILMQRYFTAL